MNTLVIVLIAAVLLSAAYVLYGLVSTVAALVLTSLDAVARIGYANIWPLFGSANQLLSALVERTIGLVKAYFKAQKESA